MIPGTVSKYTYLGREAHLQVETGIGDLVVQIANPGRNAGRNAGEAVSLTVIRDALMGFDSSGKRISTGA